MYQVMDKDTINLEMQPQSKTFLGFSWNFRKNDLYLHCFTIILPLL